VIAPPAGDPRPKPTMIWLRRILAVPVFLVGFVCAVGAVRIFAGNLPGSGVGDGIFAAIAAAAAGTGMYFLIRPDTRRLRGLSKKELLGRALANPLGLAAVLYAAAAIVMIPMPKAAILPGLVAQCAYAVLSATSATKARSWWAHATQAVLGFVLLMGALAGTAEALTKGGFGEGGMVFLLPMYGFLILLPVSSIVRLVRRSATQTPQR